MKRFNEIKTRNELADFLGISRRHLAYSLYIKNETDQYITFEIPKKSGGTRKIDAPIGTRKRIQDCLKTSLEAYRQQIRMEQSIQSKLSYGYEQGRGIIQNAEVHRNKRFLINIDIKDFFPSIHFGRIKGYFEKNKNYLLPPEVAIVLAQIVCFQGKLPQGAPTSPVISNMIFEILDWRLLKIAKKYRLNYTRYVDDMSFSTNDVSIVNRFDDFIIEISDELSNGGFSINPNKIRFQNCYQRQEVTGLIVNQKINIKHEYYKLTRAMADSLYKNGEYFIDGERGTIAQLEGRFSFAKQLDDYNRKKKGENRYTKTGRDLDYQRFVFYKRFVVNEKPLIITEGPTDILYLKAALKKYANRYPNLISRNGDTFEWKLSFLKRTNNFCDLFEVSPDGADAIKGIYQHFKSNKGHAYYFYETRNMKYGSPIIMLFDNELKIKKSPIKNFINECGNVDYRNKLETDLNEKLYSHLKYNAWIATLPIGQNEKREIEDLLNQQEVSAIRLNGKSFEKNSKDSSKYFGKKALAQHMYSNYSRYDYSGFIPLLNNINVIVSMNK